MKAVRAHFKLRLYGELPDEDGEADNAFDEWGSRILAVLNRQQPLVIIRARDADPPRGAESPQEATGTND